MNNISSLQDANHPDANEDGKAASLSTFQGSGTVLGTAASSQSQGDVAKDVEKQSSVLRNLQAARRAASNASQRPTAVQVPPASSPGAVVLEETIKLESQKMSLNNKRRGTNKPEQEVTSGGEPRLPPLPSQTQSGAKRPPRAKWTTRPQANERQKQPPVNLDSSLGDILKSCSTQAAQADPLEVKYEKNRRLQNQLRKDARRDAENFASARSQSHKNATNRRRDPAQAESNFNGRGGVGAQVPDTSTLAVEAYGATSAAIPGGNADYRGAVKKHQEQLKENQEFLRKVRKNTTSQKDLFDKPRQFGTGRQQKEIRISSAKRQTAGRRNLPAENLNTQMAGTDPTGIANLNVGNLLNVSGSQIGLSGFTTTANNQPARAEAQAGAHRRAVDFRRRQRQNSRNLEESKEAAQPGTLQFGLSGTEIGGRQVGSNANNSRTRQANPHHARNRSNNGRNPSQGARPPSFNRNQNQPNGASLGQLLGMGPAAASPRNQENSSPAARNQIAQPTAANPQPQPPMDELDQFLQDIQNSGQQPQTQPSPAALAQQRQATHAQIQSNFHRMNEMAAVFNTNVERMRTMEAQASEGGGAQPLQRDYGAPGDDMSRDPVDGVRQQHQRVAELARRAQLEAAEEQQQVRDPLPQRDSQLIGGEDGRDDPLNREILGMIRPVGSNVPSTGQNAVESAEGLFSNLRQQLDSLQSQVNTHSVAYEDDLNSGNSNMGWRQRAMVNHNRELQHLGRVQANPRLYGHTRANRQTQIQSNLTNLRELRHNMASFDVMLDEIDRFQQQTESLVHNLQALDVVMGNNNRELEPVDDDENGNKVKGLDEDDLAMQKIYNFDPKLHKLKDQTCSICLSDITDEKIEGKGALICELTCGHAFHAPCVLGWLTKQSHCCPNCRKDLRVSTKK